MRFTLPILLAGLLLPASDLFAADRAALRTYPLLQERAGVQRAAYPGESDLDIEFLRETLTFLAHDDRKGRKTGHRGLENDVFDFLIEKLQAWGLQPAGDVESASYKQTFQLAAWWPLLGIPEPDPEDHGDDEIFCSFPNEHGFAIDEQGNPVTLSEAELAERLGVDAIDEGLRAEILRSSYPTNNIVAMIPGSDPELANEVVVLGAHIDHLGSRGDAIYNGADDNGSGSTILMNLARAFASIAGTEQGPKRTLVFMWFSGEEMGLLGSQYWVENPTIDFSRVKAMLNMDMLGRTEADEISVYDGTSHQKDWVFHDWHDTDSLGLESVNHDIRSYLARSDQYPFYQKGLPVMFFFEGFRGSSHSLNADYHRQTDTVEKIDFVKLHRAAGFIYRHAYQASRLPLARAGR